MIESENWSIRKALISDAHGIITVHQNAVHRSASPFYDQEILDEWSPLASLNRESLLFEKLRDNPEKAFMLVIECMGQIAGFGEIVPSLSELRALYIDPQFGRRGFGKALLQTLESNAKQQGLARLSLHSSLNAKEFYLHNGYVVDAEGNHQLASGKLMPCVFMSKTLT
ncbi:MAG: GNAT family N-acetyltransferase [Candidatus Melainabacteria bacterium]|nr:GNAT family N-acetyltransferase [Candidatus Melainabacteria bacterium]